MANTFNPQQIDYLRREYSTINSVDPFGKSYAKMVALLDGLDQDQLKYLAAANIKFISRLALNRVVKQ